MKRSSSILRRQALGHWPAMPCGPEAGVGSTYARVVPAPNDRLQSLFPSVALGLCALRTLEGTP